MIDTLLNLKSVQMKKFANLTLSVDFLKYIKKIITSIISHILDMSDGKH